MAKEVEVVARDAPNAPPEVNTPHYRIKWLFSGRTAPGAEQTLGYVVIEPGQKNPLHAHPNCEEVLYLISGELDHSLEDAVYRLRPGDAIRVPAGVKHDARCVQERSDAVGFIGASSMERLPVETAITQTVRAFKDLPIRAKRA